jgi:hypothetical protein
MATRSGLGGPDERQRVAQGQVLGDPDHVVGVEQQVEHLEAHGGAGTDDAGLAGGRRLQQHLAAQLDQRVPRAGRDRAHRPVTDTRCHVHGCPLHRLIRRGQKPTYGCARARGGELATRR